MKKDVDDLKGLVEKLITLFPSKSNDKEMDWKRDIGDVGNGCAPLIQECHGAFVFGKEEMLQIRGNVVLFIFVECNIFFIFTWL